MRKIKNLEPVKLNYDTPECKLLLADLSESIITLLDVYESLSDGDLKDKVYITLDKITGGDMDFISIDEMREKWK